MSPLVEIVAKAMYEGQPAAETMKLPPWDQCEIQDVWRRFARLAIDTIENYHAMEARK